MTDSTNIQKEKTRFLLKRKIESIDKNFNSHLKRFEITVNPDNEISINLTELDTMCIVSIFDAWKIIVKTIKSYGNETVKIKVPTKGEHNIHIQYADTVLIENVIVY
jgi:hypothetical protein